MAPGVTSARSSRYDKEDGNYKIDINEKFNSDIGFEFKPKSRKDHF